MSHFQQCPRCGKQIYVRVSVEGSTFLEKEMPYPEISVDENRILSDQLVEEDRPDESESVSSR